MNTQIPLKILKIPKFPEKHVDISTQYRFQIDIKL